MWIGAARAETRETETSGSAATDASAWPARKGADQSMFGVRKSGVIRTEEIFQAESLQIGGYPHS